MAGRGLPSVFSRYERDRMAFASSMLDAARAEGNTAPLVAQGGIRLLLPLLTDPADAVAHTTAAALGRLAGHSSVVAANLLEAGVVGMLVRYQATVKRQRSSPAWACGTVSLSHVTSTHMHRPLGLVQLGRIEDKADEDSHGAKRAAMGVMSALTRHSAELAGAVAEQGGLAAAVSCLQNTDGEAKEAAGGVVGTAPRLQTADMHAGTKHQAPVHPEHSAAISASSCSPEPSNFAHCSLDAGPCGGALQDAGRGNSARWRAGAVGGVLEQPGISSIGLCAAPRGCLHPQRHLRAQR